MELYVLEEDTFDRVEIVDDFSSLIWTERYFEAGDFQLKVPASKEALSLYIPDRALELLGSREIMFIDNVELTTDETGMSYFLVTGYSGLSVTSRRIIWGHKRYSFSGSKSAIQTLLNESIISPSAQERKISWVSFRSTVTDDSPLDVEYEGDNLYEKLVSILKLRTLGIRSSLENNNMVLELYAGVDRSTDQEVNPFVVFSPDFENLQSSKFILSSRDYKNTTLVGGKGDPGTRPYLTVTEDASVTGLSRREIYTDASSVAQEENGQPLTQQQIEASMRAKGLDTLSEHPIYMSFDGEAVVGSTYEYGVDFFLGDIVQTSNEYGMETKSRVIEYIQTQDESGVSAYPTFEAIS